MEALRRVPRFVLEDQGKRRVLDPLDPRNVACRRLVQRVGMRNEVCLNESLRIDNA